MRLSKKQRWSIKRSGENRLNLWEGAVRSSKTVASLMKFIQTLPYASVEGDVFLIGKTLDALKRNVINLILNYVGSDAKHFPGKRELHLWNRIIYTVGANDERAEGKIRGSTVSLAYGDEVTLWPESFFKMLDSRLSLDDSLFLGTTNSDNPMHYLKKDYLDRESELDFRSYHFALDDNPFISQKVKDTLRKNYIGLWFKRFILGLWCVAEGAIYDFFDEEENTLIRPPKADWFDATIDYGTGNPTVFLLMGNTLKKTNPHVWAEREYYYDSQKQQRQKTDSEYSKDLALFLSKSTRDIDSIVESLYGIDTLLDIRRERRKEIPLHNIFVDPSALSLKVQLAKDGFVGVRDANNEVLDGIRTKATMLKTGEYAICQACKHYIEEMYGYAWDPKAQQRGEDRPMKQHDHCQDAGRYFIYTRFGERKIDYSFFTK